MNLVSSGGPMCSFAVPPIKEIKVGIIGIGSRGSGAAKRLPFIPGVRVTALCDIQADKVDGMLSWYKKNGKPDAKRYVGGQDEWKRLCDDPDVKDAIRFLREREVVHYQRFGENLRILTDKLDSKNFYAFNPEFDKKCFKNQMKK